MSFSQFLGNILGSRQQSQMLPKQHFFVAEATDCCLQDSDATS